MTSEVAILNRAAVALAADSAVTIQTQDEQKIYNTVNKLFALSKYHPIGIMVYGNADFMGVPWESIIKIYRSNLDKQKFDTVEEYADHFTAFLEQSNPLFPETQQSNYFYGIVATYFSLINDEIIEKVQAIIEKDGKIQDQQISTIISNTIKEHYEDWERLDTLPSIPKDHAQNTIDKYAELIKRAKDEIFEKLPISRTSSNRLKKICGNLFSKNRFPTNISGVAIAGFGEKEAFPVLVSIVTEAVINNRLKYIRDDRSSKIDFESTAAIIPFAQSQMVATFMEGIDPFYRLMLDAYLSNLFDEYPDIVVESIPQLNEDEKKELAKKLKDAGNAMLSEFNQEMQNYRGRKHIHPIINTVAILPKDQLAEMAESLVSLTSFKQKISMDAETVGGPIDVAIISKGDGFIWIKRKHYFKADLNPYFFANYYREDQD